MEIVDLGHAYPWIPTGVGRGVGRRRTHQSPAGRVARIASASTVTWSRCRHLPSLKCVDAFRLENGCSWFSACLPTALVVEQGEGRGRGQAPHRQSSWCASMWRPKAASRISLPAADPESETADTVHGRRPRAVARLWPARVLIREGGRQRCPVRLGQVHTLRGVLPYWAIVRRDLRQLAGGGRPNA